MKRFKSIYKFLSLSILQVGVLTTIIFLLSSCVDDNISGSESSKYNPENDPDMVCIPLNISFGTTKTRAEDEDRLSEGPGFVYGDEHVIDFETENESYAIIFNKDGKPLFLSPLYQNTQLGTGTEYNSGNIEYSVPVVIYLPANQIGYDPSNGSSDLLSILVVLNGGRMYSKVSQRFNELKDNTQAQTMMLDIIWDEEADGVIGFNEKGLFTMTNSAYYNSDAQLVTTTPIAGKVYASVKQYLEETNPQPSASVRVERMVAKFIPPTFSTDVIGSDKVFRPDDNSLAMIINTWEGDFYKEEKRTWRIHLLGWTINGTESQNYLFKNIPASSNPGNEWWNDPGNYRSYWSVDPHYDSENSDGGYDFYPWQFRKAADYDYTISMEFGKDNGKQAVLNYKSFDEVYWSSEELYVQENTFNPYGNWYNSSKVENGKDVNNESYLDNRESLLAASHLLVTAELLIQNEHYDDFDYIGEYGRVKDLYGDRNQRFYLTEKDWFKMFIRDFNDALNAQETMSFYVYDWDKKGNRYSGHLICETTGEYKIYYDGQLLTNNLIDEIFKESNLDSEGYLISNHDDGEANVRNGDGRLIPWIEGGHLDPTNPLGLEVKRPDSTGLTYHEEGGTTNYYEWTSNMYKSLFYEWFGPIDHYKRGYMYYAGEIKHHDAVTEGGYNFYGPVRNHIYRFNIQSINSPGIPVDNPSQKIIPEKHAYQDEVGVWLEVIDWHPEETEVELQ